jgi:hypothetical protein
MPIFSTIENQRVICQDIEVVWNTLPYVTHHRTGTKTYGRVKFLIDQLKRGNWFNYLVGKNELAENLKINMSTLSELLMKKWSFNERREVYYRINAYHSLDYFPLDKKNAPKNLFYSLYNKRTNRSLFLRLWLKPPIRIQNQDKELSGVVNKILNLIPYNKDINEAVILDHLNDLEIYYKTTIWPYIKNQESYYIWKFLDFIYIYLNAIKDENVQIFWFKSYYNRFIRFTNQFLYEQRKDTLPKGFSFN